MKNLPIGIQTLTEIRNRNCVYVDKTSLVHHMVTTGKYYFLARPRRFGKSLLVSTLKELFQGNKAVFEGLWIEDRWDWTKKHPLLHFSFDELSYNELGLINVLKSELKEKAGHFGITLKKTGLKGMFSELLEKLSQKNGQIVLLVDEYDKPITDYLDDQGMEQAKANRDLLRDFYGVLKNADQHLELVFITGITKFSKVSIFSHLNNLSDITLDSSYSRLTGYTQEELEASFGDYLEIMQTELNVSRQALIDHMRAWYNGFSWDGVQKLYNPFGILNCLQQRRFLNFWFSTGSPRFLIEQMRKQFLFNVEKVAVHNVVFEKFDLENMELIPLLFQTGYLTVIKSDPWTGDYILDYPNKEVRESMYQFLIDDLSRNPHRTHTGHTVKDLQKAFVSEHLGQVQAILNSILSDLPSETFDKQSEGLYHGLIHVIFSYLGLYISSEVHSSQGRADAVVQTPTDVFIFEFKFNKTAQEAIDQILKQDYAGKYQASGKKITAVGVNFDSKEKQIDDWVQIRL